MVRTARFSADAFVKAAIALVAEGGPSAATIGAVARAVGAPTGSVYHRFASRDAVVATAWAEVHGGFVQHVAPALHAGSAAAAALALVGWARADAVRARFLLLNESGTLYDAAPPPELREEIRRQEEEIDAAFAALLERTGGTGDPAAIARARFRVFDGPIALLRPHLLAGAVPAYVDRLVLELHGVPADAPGLASGKAA
ncbi:MAG TPA: helix-turn-helix domain-containing protein [Azospirillaceae bacterium]|nr:helix-turn-helix domain-containing protein [Azospirillaceae bacterium]